MEGVIKKVGGTRWGLSLLIVIVLIGCLYAWRLESVLGNLRRESGEVASQVEGTLERVEAVLEDFEEELEYVWGLEVALGNLHRESREIASQVEGTLERVEAVLGDFEEELEGIKHAVERAERGWEHTRERLDRICEGLDRVKDEIDRIERRGISRRRIGRFRRSPGISLRWRICRPPTWWTVCRPPTWWTVCRPPSKISRCQISVGINRPSTDFSRPRIGIGRPFSRPRIGIGRP